MKYLRLIEGIVLLTLVFSSCVKESSYYEGETKDGNFILTNNVAQRVNEEMILKIMDISDTRCPVGTVCSSVGNVKVLFQVYANKEFNDLEITYSTFHESNCDTIKGYTISIINVTPHPYIDSPEIDSLDYRVIVKVEKY